MLGLQCYKVGRCDPFTTRSYTTYPTLEYIPPFQNPGEKEKKIDKKKAHPNVP
jgi:hypothetical protein